MNRKKIWYASIAAPPSGFPYHIKKCEKDKGLHGAGVFLRAQVKI